LSDKHIKHINAVFRQKIEFFNVKSGGEGARRTVIQEEEEEEEETRW